VGRFRSLTSRLVLTAVALVAVFALLIGAATTVAVRDQLLEQLDQKVVESAQRIDRQLRPRPGDDDVGNQAPGTLVAVLGVDQPAGEILGDRPGESEPLSDAALEELEAVPVDGQVHQVGIGRPSDYRVLATKYPNAVVVTGLPTSDLDDTVSSLLLTEALLFLLATLAAAGLGTVVVRRQLRPLREVAATAHAVSELPLASGAIALEERVPEHLTDERTEVGQVGSALNAMLEHVEASLGARHRSEQQVRRFVADASHELRTPLTTIAGYTELARSRPDDRAAADTALAKVEQESGRMTALVEDLLLLACPRPRAPVAALAARGVRRGSRRRAATAPGRDEPAGERSQVHAGRHHRHRLRPRGWLRRPRRRPRLPRRPRRPRLRAVRPRRRRAYPR
jgi:two-component system OmpR family sensor kinase